MNFIHKIPFFLIDGFLKDSIWRIKDNQGWTLHSEWWEENQPRQLGKADCKFRVGPGGETLSAIDIIFWHHPYQLKLLFFSPPYDQYLIWAALILISWIWLWIILSVIFINVNLRQLYECQRDEWENLLQLEEPESPCFCPSGSWHRHNGINFLGSSEIVLGEFSWISGTSF